MKVVKAHKIRLNPTPEQKQYFWKACNVARFAFNWGLAEYNRRFELGDRKLKITGKGNCLIKEFVILKNTEFVWANEVTTWAYQGAFADLKAAIIGYFKKKKNGTLNRPKDSKPRKDGKPFGWPRFKNKYKSTPSFYLANIALRFDRYDFWFDKKRVGWINMTEKLRFVGRILGARISYKNNYWWLSVQVEIEQEMPIHNNDAIGIDFGVKYLAVTSDGQIFDNPKLIGKIEKKLGRLQRKLDRQRRVNNPDNYNENGTVKKKIDSWYKSQNMIKTEKKINKLHYQIACTRKEISHTMTTDIARNYGIIGIEDLNIRGMMSNGNLAKSIGDAALYKKRRQLEYKSEWLGGKVIAINRWFPSSKMCSGCRCINTELTLSDRQWICPNCNQLNHRDGNAAINIKNEALKIISSPDYSDGDVKRLNGNAGQRSNVVKKSIHV